MNLWLLCAILLLGGLFTTGVICCFCSDLLGSIIAMELASGIAILTIVMLAQGWGYPSWYDMAIALALLNFPGAMVFVLFLERWI
jgi:multisubunit Na+/H+ antiporter MnhF subunit